MAELWLLDLKIKDTEIYALYKHVFWLTSVDIGLNQAFLSKHLHEQNKENFTLWPIHT
jgi:hypothetical protein